MMMLLLLPLISPLAAPCVTQEEPAGLRVFESGQDGYHTYRIPSLTVTPKGTVLAICEGRSGGQGDSGDIDLIAKRSVDGGATWSEQKVIWSDEENTCGNPCTVVDRTTGTIWLFSTWNLGGDHEGDIIRGKSQDTRRVFVMSSQDDGLTWSKPTDVTASTKEPEWTWYATGPGSGIQVLNGEHAGRLVIPCDHIEAESKHYYSHVIYSDDHGASWKLGGRTPNHQVNECEVAELSDGRLMLNMRNYDRAKKNRQTALSRDGGLTWTEQTFAESLVDPICQASIERVEAADPEGKPSLVFCNAADESKRVAMTMRVSRDDGKSWTTLAVLHQGPSAYSDLASLGPNQVACLFEAGSRHPYETITFKKISLP